MNSPLDQLAAARPPTGCTPEGFLASRSASLARRRGRVQNGLPGRWTPGADHQEAAGRPPQPNRRPIPQQPIGQAAVVARTLCRDRPFPWPELSRSDPALVVRPLLIQLLRIPATSAAVLPGLIFLPLGRALGLGWGLGHCHGQRSLRQLDPACWGWGPMPLGWCWGRRASGPPAGAYIPGFGAPPGGALGLGVGLFGLPAGPCLLGRPRCWTLGGRWRSLAGGADQRAQRLGAPRTAALRRSLLGPGGGPPPPRPRGPPNGGLGGVPSPPFSPPAGWPRPCLAVTGGGWFSCCSARVLAAGLRPGFAADRKRPSAGKFSAGVSTYTPKAKSSSRQLPGRG